MAAMGVVHTGAAPGRECTRMGHRTDGLPGIIRPVTQQMQGAATSVTEQHVVAQIVPDHQAANEMLAHHDIHEIEALLSRDEGVEPERVRDLLAEHLERLLLVHVDAAAEVVVLVQQPE